MFVVNTHLYSQKRIAILELDAHNISNTDVKALSDRLRFELHNTGYFTVLERAFMTGIPEEQGFYLSECVDYACII